MWTQTVTKLHSVSSNNRCNGGFSFWIGLKMGRIKKKSVSSLMFHGDEE